MKTKISMLATALMATASMAAAITVTKSGAAETIPDISIVQERLQL